MRVLGQKTGGGRQMAPSLFSGDPPWVKIQQFKSEPLKALLIKYLLEIHVFAYSNSVYFN